jgi:hypothetical protein
MATKNSCAMLMLATLATVSLSATAMAQQSGSARIQTSRLTTGRAQTPSQTITVHDHRKKTSSGATTTGRARIPRAVLKTSSRKVTVSNDRQKKSSGARVTHSGPNRDGRQTDPIHLPQPIERVKHVKKGGWRTLENIWNAKATIVFQRPVGAKVKIRYGSTKKYFGKDRQKKFVAANRPAVLNVGRFSAVRARVQIYVKVDTDVTYFYYPGGVNSVDIKF